MRNLRVKLELNYCLHRGYYMKRFSLWLYSELGHTPLYFCFPRLGAQMHYYRLAGLQLVHGTEVE